MSESWFKALDSRYDYALDLYTLQKYSDAARELDGLIGEFLMLSGKAPTLSIQKNPLPLDHICYKAVVLHMQAQFELGDFDGIDRYLVRRFNSLIEMPIQLYNRWSVTTSSPLAIAVQIYSRAHSPHFCLLIPQG